MRVTSPAVCWSVAGLTEFLQDIIAEAAHWSAFNEQLQTLEKTIDVPR